MATCKRCGKDISFIKMKTGKYMPTDKVKHSIIIGEGNEQLITEQGVIIRGRYASYEDGANGCGYTSHFATCPYANEFRKG